MGTLVFGVLVTTGMAGLALLALPRTQRLGRRLCRFGFLGAVLLLGAFLMLSLVTLPFD